MGNKTQIAQLLGLICTLLYSTQISAAARLLEPSPNRDLRAVALPVIVGGQVVTEDLYPFAAVIFDKSQPYCSGALINPQVIITAGHCTESEYVGVKIGTRNWLLDDIYGRDYYARQISKVIVHPDFKKNLDRIYADMLGDVALMVLSSPLPLNFTTIKLADSSTKIPNTLTTVGYGTTSEGGGVMSPVLRAVNLTLVDRKKCNTLLNRVNPGAYKLTDSVVCAGWLPGGKDTCQGDSGGPLLIKGKTPADDVLVGTVSFGEGCARKNVPAGYANIAKYNTWINDQLKKLESDGVIPSPPTPINPGRKN